MKIDDSALISVLIPARNEEKNINSCLNFILAQDYKNIEVLVLDDQSTDQTKEIVNSFCKKHKNTFYLEGESLPPNWTGKNWACHQLSLKAKGKYLLFVDADVELALNAISSAVKIMLSTKTKMLSVFPTQRIISFGERLIVPLMNWLLLSFLPLRKVFSSNNKSFIAANGQFMLWDKETYFSIGGHKQVADAVVEDMELAKKAKQHNKIITLLGGNIIFCRMYNSFLDAFKGFSKNFYPGFKLNPLIFIGLILFLFFLFTVSSVFAFTDSNFLIVVMLIVINRILISQMSHQNPFLNVFLHPIQMILMLLIGINSVASTKLGYAKWKGRRL
ncbi:MAG: glycosyltransferase [Ignavibacteriaceae bacterium]|nr:glycosyltransferase [Ignavibacteriaceae bacterium]